MLKNLFKRFTKDYYKQYFIILHIPTNQYVRVKRSVLSGDPMGLELDPKPTYFYYFPWNKWHTTKTYADMLTTVDCFYITYDDNDTAKQNPRWYKKAELTTAEFELIEVDRSQAE